MKMGLLIPLSHLPPSFVEIKGRTWGVRFLLRLGDDKSCCRSVRTNSSVVHW